MDLAHSQKVLIMFTFFITYTPFHSCIAYIHSVHKLLHFLLILNNPLFTAYTNTAEN